jgi:hypothetical protein
MLDFPLNTTDEAILEGVRRWIDLLAAEQYDQAVRCLYQPSDMGQTWTPSLLKSLITNYGFIEPRTDGKTYRVTSPSSTTLGRSHPYQDVEWFPHDSAQASRGVAGFVTFDLPLNGEWSDVTATFLIHKVSGRLLLQLEDIHVL